MPKQVLTVGGYVIMRPVKELKHGDVFNLSINAPYDLKRLEYDRSRKMYKVMDIRSKREGYINGDACAIIGCEIWTNEE